MESEDENAQEIINYKSALPKDIQRNRETFDKSPGIDFGLPPNSYDLKFNKASQPRNFRFASDPVTDENVKINPAEEAKIISIAQDLIYTESKRRKQTQIACSWDGRVRQMTDR